MTTIESSSPAGITGITVGVRPGPVPPTLFRAGLTAGALSAAVNGILFLAGRPFGLFPQDVLIRGVGAPITFVRVIIVSLLGVGAGVAVFGLLRRIAARPLKVFGWIALGVLLLSFTQPSMALGGVPVRMVVALNAMHVATAATLWIVLRRAFGGRGSGAVV